MKMTSESVIIDDYRVTEITVLNTLFQFDWTVGVSGVMANWGIIV